MHRYDTITAIATATGPGAVGIIRLSGRHAETILRQCFAGLPETPESHRLYLGRVVHPGGETIDEALAVVMRGARSFTGETVAELQCHGGALNLRRVLDATLAAGARHADPGEFSLRAFLNGRLDLTRAEAIADVVTAESDAALRAAQAQLGGALHAPILRLRADLLDALTLVEASIDFAGEEHVYQLDLEETARRIQGPLDAIQRMLRAHTHGRLLLAGVRVVLVGLPNVGKSSLFNAVIGEERAIVTDIPGTTRDVIEEHTALGGQRVQLVDTAGLRQTEDAVEKIGVARTREQASVADLVAWVVDASSPSAPPPEFLDALSRDAALCVVNKVDRLDGDPRGPRGQRADVIDAMTRQLPTGAEVATVSATTGEGLAWLEATLSKLIARLQARGDEDTPFVTSARHAEALGRSSEALGRAVEATRAASPLEFIAADLRDGVDALAAIIGEVASDDVLNAIFGQFCVGK